MFVVFLQFQSVFIIIPTSFKIANVIYLHGVSKVKIVAKELMLYRFTRVVSDYLQLLIAACYFRP